MAHDNNPDLTRRLSPLVRDFGLPAVLDSLTYMVQWQQECLAAEHNEAWRDWWELAHLLIGASNLADQVKSPGNNP